MKYSFRISYFMVLKTLACKSTGQKSCEASTDFFTRNMSNKYMSA
jgi:hypothetical protein